MTNRMGEIRHGPQMSHLRLAVGSFEARLRGCVLCLAAFPEGAVIKKRMLLHWWVAEGFVRSADEGKSRFDELIAQLWRRRVRAPRVPARRQGTAAGGGRVQSRGESHIYTTSGRSTSSAGSPARRTCACCSSGSTAQQIASWQPHGQPHRGQRRGAVPRHGELQEPHVRQLLGHLKDRVPAKLHRQAAPAPGAGPPGLPQPRRARGI